MPAPAKGMIQHMGTKIIDASRMGRIPRALTFAGNVPEVDAEIDRMFVDPAQLICIESRVVHRRQIVLELSDARRADQQ